MDIKFGDLGRKQIGRYLVWHLSLELIKTRDKTTVLAVILIWQLELKPPS